MPLESRQRDPDVAVERGSGDVALLFLQADDLEASAGDSHGLTQWVDGGKQLVDEHGAQNGDLPRLHLLRLSEEAPALDRQIADLGEIGGGTDQGGSLVAPGAGSTSTRRFTVAP